MTGKPLDGQVAVVTGASKNIGLAIARAFAVAGAAVAMVARGSEELHERAAEISLAEGADVLVVPADVSSEADVAALVTIVQARWPRIDCLVNNAYSMGGPRSKILDYSDEAFELAYRTNVLGPLRLSRAFAGSLAADGGGSIINVISGCGLQVAPLVGAYGSTKAALWMMTRYIAAEYAPAIRCNALMPGMVREDTTGWDADPTVSQLIGATPMGRYGHPAEVAPAAVFLASAAASYTTGALIAVNGGRAW